MLRDRHDPGASGATATDARADEAKDRAILCASCGAPVADEADRIDAFGAHEHDRLNPSGILFRIGCFARAPGTRPMGASSDEFPWFPGHRWRVVVCRSCFTHLGWEFATGTIGFVGVIVDRVRPSE
jgi:hypothetical protein